MTRDELLFSIRYSFYIEKMHAILYARLDRLLTFVQITLGSAIFATYGSAPLFGAVIAVISIASFVWQPGKTAMLHEIQAKQMKALITMPDSVSDADLHAAYVKVEEGDNPTLGMLRDPAYKRALISLGRSSESAAIKLNMSEKVAAWFSGDLPKDE
ncbi:MULTISPECIES: hypothetical protein [Edwardsiella]|uniref:Uncharacterized protein n=2 Tax=Edwardsiella anguillarum TaxID=1821960 RepID=A0A076LVS0_9GAMM|nr:MULTISPECIES: hypothetical protein [Edwardsiella]AIJ10563.1 Hypothetical protein ETEE_4158 [Edwardsiella anguillarum ET080813]AKR78029.1 hypothetical protein AAZ33_10615 [Edwardsiella sp. LADL05-105]KAB0587640.1 hypothetical protein F7P84_17555 [Edwardsiella anguillarum]UCQ23102.1 hypothetical protein DCE91_09890 [Edwardsiella piscicida]WHP82395.1 hypothetical protein MQ095_11315 [Edwardsiella anguillarum]